MTSLARLVLFLAAPLAAPAAEKAESPVGKQIEAFQLQDYLGTPHSLADWSEKKALVVVFLGTECPLAGLYGQRLAELAAKYAPQEVAFVGVNSNRQDSLAEIAHYARTHGIEFPILKDPGNAVADRFGAVRTPEAFVLDGQRVVRYWGRIDNQYGVGYARAAATANYLAEALDQVLAGQSVTTPAVEALGCHIGRVHRKPPTGDVTYTKHIAPILQRRCMECHRSGQIAPFALTGFDDAASWSESIREAIGQGRMPPWHASPEHGQFRNDARLPDDEKALIYQWIDGGMQEGDPADLPPPAKFVEGWRIRQPDVAYRMPQPYTVPAKGVVQYQYFTVDPGFTEDKWLAAAEARPGNRAVTHHLILFYHPPGSDKIKPEEPLFNVLAAFAPGMPPSVYSKGYSRRIPAGSKLVFQVHYTPNGTEQADQSEAGLVFADLKTVKKEIQVAAAFNFRFQIPPGAADHRVEAAHRFEEDTLLYSLAPHMHLRGKSFRFEARYPGGASEVLLDVPRYDFNWQNFYLLTDPKRLPAGTEVHCYASYDNSDDNLLNPDPNATVTWGDQTWQEMMVGSFGVAPGEQDLSLGPPQVAAVEGDEYEALFAYRPPQPVEAVYLAGTFNDWDPTGHRMDGPDADGRYTTRLRLNRGRHEYKFVLNGETWRADPGNPDQAGTYRNSVLRVGEGQQGGE